MAEREYERDAAGRFGSGGAGAVVAKAEAGREVASLAALGEAKRGGGADVVAEHNDLNKKFRAFDKGKMTLEEIAPDLVRVGENAARAAEAINLAHPKRTETLKSLSAELKTFTETGYERNADPIDRHKTRTKIIETLNMAKNTLDSVMRDLKKNK